MRAHFAGDVSDCDMAPTETLATRIVDFKSDTQNMQVLTEFIDEVLQQAETQAAGQQAATSAATTAKTSQQPKEKTRQSFAIPDFKNGKVVNRARGLVVRIFDAICNCANSAAGPAQRIKLRGKRQAAAANKQQGNEDAKKLEKQQEEQPEIKPKAEIETTAMEQ